MLKTGRPEQDSERVWVSRTITQIMSRQFAQFQTTEAWRPDVNVYQLEGRIEICVDLAGVVPESIEVHVTSEQVIIRGIRHAPDPRAQSHQPMRIVAMEIDHGPFNRVINIPDRVDYGGVRTEYIKGLLWVRLPLRAAG